jgi:hypothetical protein
LNGPTELDGGRIVMIPRHTEDMDEAFGERRPDRADVAVPATLVRGGNRVEVAREDDGAAHGTRNDPLEAELLERFGHGDAEQRGLPRLRIGNDAL